jgi:hypothetical protein
MMEKTAEALEAKGIPAERIKVSLERRMKCAVGLCGECQCGKLTVCEDGPVFKLSEIRKETTELGIPKVREGYERFFQIGKKLVGG